MSKNELNYLNASEVIKLIKSRKTSVKELISACFKQMKKIDKIVNAWEYLDMDYAIKQAEIIDSEISERKFFGSLYGIPVGINDIFNTDNMPTEMGSPIWKGFMPGSDARVVTKLKLAGAIIPGKTSTAEFGINRHPKKVNPHNPKHLTWSSCNGSAAAVAAYMVSVALGTQSAGSIIRPASYCGIIGFKPSFGLIPRTGVLKTAGSLDQIGFFVRACDDLILIFDIIRVKGLNYPISHRLLNNNKRQNKKQKKWRVGIVKSQLWVWDYAEPYVKDQLNAFIHKLSRDNGLELVDTKMTPEFNSAHKIHDLIYEKSLSYNFQDEHNKQPHLISKSLRKMIEQGNKISLSEYLQALDNQSNLAKKLDEIFRDIDIIITYATSGVATEGLDTVDKPDSCLIWTLCGVPVINMPIFRGPKRLPFGLQIIARKYNDLLLLKFISYLKKRNFVFDGTFPGIRAKLKYL